MGSIDHIDPTENASYYPKSLRLYAIHLLALLFYRFFFFKSSCFHHKELKPGKKETREKSAELNITVTLGKYSVHLYSTEDLSDSKIQSETCYSNGTLISMFILTEVLPVFPSSLSTVLFI